MTTLQCTIRINFDRDNERDMFVANIEVYLEKESKISDLLHPQFRSRDVICCGFPLIRCWGEVSEDGNSRVRRLALQSEDLDTLDGMVTTFIDSSYRDLRNLVGYNREQQSKIDKNPRIATFEI